VSRDAARGENIYHPIASKGTTAVLAVLYDQFCTLFVRGALMSIDMANFTPGLSLAGGLMIGAAAAVLVLFNGRIAGISGILGGLLASSRNDAGWRVAFLTGLLGAPVLASLLSKPISIVVQAGWTEVLLAGFLVGIGTRYASGCTSGHGVCGISRGSVRSFVATATFMASGVLTAYVYRHLLGG
jgi:uncharacterized membrane protein YedE/YeeE